MIFIKNTHVTQKTNVTDESSGKQLHNRYNKKLLAFRCLIILTALLDIYFEINWLIYFFDITCEWFQNPYPNYGTMMEYRHIIRLLCSLSVIIWAIRRNEISSHSMLGQKWKAGQSLVLLFLIAHLAISCMELIYNIRWIYTYGWYRIGILEIIVPILIMVAWILFMLNILPPCFIIFFISFDWSFYTKINILKSLGGEGLWINSYVDIVEKGIFALIMILVVIGTKLIDFEYK